MAQAVNLNPKFSSMHNYGFTRVLKSCKTMYTKVFRGANKVLNCYQKKMEKGYCSFVKFHEINKVIPRRNPVMEGAPHLLQCHLPQLYQPPLVLMASASLGS